MAVHAPRPVLAALRNNLPLERQSHSKSYEMKRCFFGSLYHGNETRNQSLLIVFSNKKDTEKFRTEKKRYWKFDTEKFEIGFRRPPISIGSLTGWGGILQPIAHNAFLRRLTHVFPSRCGPQDKGCREGTGSTRAGWIPVSEPPK